MKKRVYISGPMSGISEMNYPAFHAAEAKLMEMGYDVENPANNPDPEPKTWEGFMRLSVRQVCECDCVVCLPGWEDSRGANVEVALAKTLSMGVYELDDFIHKQDGD